MTVLVFLDPDHAGGRVADASLPQLSVLDQGTTRGDGVFESMLYTGGSVRKLDAHLARLATSAAACELPLPRPERWRAAVETAVAEYVAAEQPGFEDEAVVKLLATRGPEGGTGSVWVTAAPAPESGRLQREEGLAVVTLDRGYDSAVAERAPWLLLGAKTLSYAVNMAALRHARGVGADDGQQVDLTMFGVEPGGFLAPKPADGGALGGPAGIVVSESLRGDGIDLGTVITLDRINTELEVVGGVHRDPRPHRRRRAAPRAGCA